MKNSEKLRQQAEIWQARANSAVEEALVEGQAREAKFREKANRLLGFAAAAQVKEAEKEKDQEMGLIFAIETKARRALNDWSAVRIRERMQEIRNVQRRLLELDDMDRARDLDKLFNALRLRAEGFEYAQIEREVYGAASADKTHEELEQLVQERWEEHRMSL